MRALANDSELGEEDLSCNWSLNRYLTLTNRFIELVRIVSLGNFTDADAETIIVAIDDFLLSVHNHVVSRRKEGPLSVSFNSNTLDVNYAIKKNICLIIYVTPQSNILQRYKLGKNDNIDSRGFSTRQLYEKNSNKMLPSVEGSTSIF